MTTIHYKHQRRASKASAMRGRMRKTTERPRLSVFRSLKNISVQVIDDLRGHTVAAASSGEKDLRTQLKGMRKIDVAKKIGALVAERSKRAGVTKVAFDRGAYKYHGRIKALAEGAREGGLEF